MILSTLIGFNESLSRFLFASGSDVLMDLIYPQLYYSVILVILFAFLVFYYNNFKKVTLYNFALSITFFFWLLSGRTVAFFPDGRLISGWFYFETNRVDICKNDIDCEKIYYYDTSYQNKFFFFYRIKNKEIETKIFVGPFLVEKTETLFYQNFANGRK
jgi:hypothetical protein